MSMSTHVVGFKPPDEKWKKMKDIWDACNVAAVPIPDEVNKFFGYSIPDSAGVEAEIEYRAYDDGNGRDGFEVDIKKLPEDVTIIRFWNSW
ncbi:MAG: hypothetical protein ACTSW7_00740 [Candidatus Thorarchaeota archaeon]|nr:hypothetical protein [Thermoplasmatales archaeon]